MRKFVLIFASLLLAFQAAAQVLGTKRDMVTASPTSSGPIVRPMDLIQMVVALAIVALLVKWVVPKVVAKLGKRISTPIGSTIKLEESASFGGGQLQIVTVRGRTLLLCVATSGVTCLSDLTASEPTGESATPAFFDFLDNADPAKAIVTELLPQTEESAMSVEDAIALIESAKTRIVEPQVESPLDRLNRLTGVQ